MLNLRGLSVETPVGLHARSRGAANREADVFSTRLDSWHLRIAFIAMGLVAWLIFMGATGRIGGTPRGTVIIQFGQYPDEFAGLDVEVDGKVVGELQYMHGQTRTGFALTEGDHDIRVTGANWSSEPRKIEVGRDRTVTFLLDAQENATVSGELQPILVLR